MAKFHLILSVMIIGCTFGLRLIYESIKKKVKLIFFAGVMIIFMSLVYFTLISSIVGIPTIIVGLLYKISQSKEIIKKKYVFLLVALSLYNISMMLFTYLPIAIVFTILNVLVFISFCFFYLGLREEPEKTNKQKPTKEIKIKDEIFRISQYRQEVITEEEISISKEKKICLVCKGKVGGYNFICSECGAFYCLNCANALSDLENACWVCNSPFDPTKPSKLLLEEKKEEIEVDEKYQKEI